MWGTATINISNGFDGRTGDEEYLVFPDTPFGREEQQRGEVASSVIGEEEEAANDTSKPFPLPPDIFAEVHLFHHITILKMHHYFASGFLLSKNIPLLAIYKLFKNLNSKVRLNIVAIHKLFKILNSNVRSNLNNKCLTS